MNTQEEFKISIKENKTQRKLDDAEEEKVENLLDRRKEALDDHT